MSFVSISNFDQASFFIFSVRSFCFCFVLWLTPLPPPLFVSVFFEIEKIAHQVVEGKAPKQKLPFRLWKQETGEASYDKKMPS